VHVVLSHEAPRLEARSGKLREVIVEHPATSRHHARL
jgi:hypothetical protein